MINEAAQIISEKLDRLASDDFYIPEQKSIENTFEIIIRGVSFIIIVITK